MERMLILCGNKESWDVALRHKIWGVKPQLSGFWNGLLKEEFALFYVTKSVKRVMGIGRVKEKIDPRDRPPDPLWPDEIREGKVVYPYRFQFEIIHICRDPSLEGIKIDDLRISVQRGASSITDEHSINELSRRIESNWKIRIFEGKKEPESDIDRYIKHATESINKYPRMSEANTISQLIEPLLEILGWNTRNLDEVEKEYPVPGGKGAEYVDIALKIDNKPKVFVEAKSVGTDVTDYLAQQLINYAILGNVNWCALTNGREWRIYNVFWKVKGIEQRLFFKLTINEFSEKLSKLLLLSKDNVVDSSLDKEGQQEYTKRMISEWFRQNKDVVVNEIIKLDSSLDKERTKELLGRIFTTI